MAEAADKTADKTADGALDGAKDAARDGQRAGGGKTAKSGPPAPIRAARAALDRLAAEDPERAAAWRRILPPLAMQLAGMGREVTAESLLAELARGDDHLAALQAEMKAARRAEKRQQQAERDFATLKARFAAQEGAEKDRSSRSDDPRRAEFEALAAAGDSTAIERRIRQSPARAEARYQAFLAACRVGPGATVKKLTRKIPRGERDSWRRAGLEAAGRAGNVAAVEAMPAQSSFSQDYFAANPRRRAVQYALRGDGVEVLEAFPEALQGLLATGHSMKLAGEDASDRVIELITDKLYRADQAAEGRSRAAESRAGSRAGSWAGSRMPAWARPSHAPARALVASLLARKRFDLAALVSVYMEIEPRRDSGLSERQRDRLASLRGNVVQWRQRRGEPVPPGLEGASPFLHKPELFEEIQGWLASEGVEGRRGRRLAYNLAALFTTRDRVLQFYRRWGATAGGRLADLAEGIRLPPGGRPDIKAWGDGVLAGGPAVGALAVHGDRIAPGRTLAETRDAAALHAYENGAQAPELARLCMSHDVREADFEAARKLAAEERAKLDRGERAPGELPDIEIDGAEFGLTGATFRRLPDGDVRGLFLGEFVDCCQSIGRIAGDSVARSGFSKPSAGFYIIEKEGEILGESFAWRGRKGELVFDSLETLGSRVSPDQWRRLLERVAARLGGDPAFQDVTRLRVGTGGGTPRLSLPRTRRGGAADPRDAALPVRDSRRQYKIPIPRGPISSPSDSAPTAPETPRPAAPRTPGASGV